MDFTSPSNEEGVMDSLMEALKTGSAFSRDEKRKKTARPAGGQFDNYSTMLSVICCSSGEESTAGPEEV